MRLLASVGVVAEHADGTFGLTQVGRLLSSDVPGSLRAVALQMAGPWEQRAWTDLLHTATTGEPAFDHAFGSELFDFLAENPGLADVFNQAMAFFAADVSAAVAASYDFSAVRTLVDVGGGYGVLLATLLEKYPKMRGILCELPQVAERARLSIADRGLADRCTVVAGDFFESVPAVAGTYVLKSVIHAWDDEAAIKILSNCRAGMEASDRLLVIDIVMPDRIDPSASGRKATAGDVNMLVHTRGRERTGRDFQILLEKSGFAMTGVYPTGELPSGVRGVGSIIEAAPAAEELPVDAA